MKNIKEKIVVVVLLISIGVISMLFVNLQEICTETDHDSSSYLKKLETSNSYNNTCIVYAGIQEDGSPEIRFCTGKGSSVLVEVSASQEFFIDDSTYFLNAEPHSYYDYVLSGYCTGNGGSLYCRIKSALNGEWSEAVQIY